MLGIIELLIVVLVLGALIVGITLWATGGSSKGTGEMSCGGCGYAVRGLEALNCPECGADLRMVGINRPKSGAARNVGIALTIGTLLLLLTCFGSWFLFSSQPSSMQSAPANRPNPSLQQSTGGQPLQADPPEIQVEDLDNSEETTDAVNQ
jgi:hypothetical protein